MRNIRRNEMPSIGAKIMRFLEIIFNENRRYLPKHNEDLPIFMHCFNGSIEVTSDYFDENKFLLHLHGVDFSVEFE